MGLSKSRITINGILMTIVMSYGGIGSNINTQVKVQKEFEYKKFLADRIPFSPETREQRDELEGRLGKMQKDFSKFRYVPFYVTIKDTLGHYRQP